MEDNLAHELEAEEQATVANSAQRAYEQPVQQPSEAAPSIEPIPQAKPVSKGLTKFEIGLMMVIGVIVFGLILMNVQSSLALSDASRSVQDVNSQIQETQVEVENLEQQSQELSRYDRINDIAEKYGLDLHDDNIVNIAPQE